MPPLLCFFNEQTLDRVDQPVGGSLRLHSKIRQTVLLSDGRLIQVGRPRAEAANIAPGSASDVHRQAETPRANCVGDGLLTAFAVPEMVAVNTSITRTGFFSD